MRRIGPALGSFEAVDLADDVDLGDRFEGPPLARRWDRCGAGPVDLADDVDLGDRLEGPPLARIGRRGGLGQQIVTTKILRRRVFALAGRITRSAMPIDPASSPALALGGAVQPRPGPTASHSTPSLTEPVHH